MLGKRTIKKALAGTPFMEGIEGAVDLMDQPEYAASVVPGISRSSRGFYKQLSDEKGINLKTPVKLAGAVATRALVDVGSDGTRNVYWRYNHPMQVLTRAYEGIVGEGLRDYNFPQKSLISLGAIGIPVGASLGTYDITNLGELGRPKGFAQQYPEQGADDRRQTNQVIPELIDRFALGRQGRPLKFETAKQDIPDLTKQRYSNYQNFLYNEKGPLGVGIIKGTRENLQGEPEIRLAGFPIGAQAIGAAIGGAGGVRLATRGNVPTKEKIGKQEITRVSGKPKVSATRALAAGAGGAVVGALAGKLANTMLAARGNPELPSTYQYDTAVNQHEQALTAMLESGEIDEQQYQAML